MRQAIALDGERNYSTLAQEGGGNSHGELPPVCALGEWPIRRANCPPALRKAAGNSPGK